MTSRHKFYFVIILLWFLGLAFYAFCFVKLAENENAIAIRYSTGEVEKEIIYNSGIHIKAPLDQFIIYNIDWQEVEYKVNVLTKDSISYDIEFNFRFLLRPSKLGFLHEEVGKNYIEKIVKPEIQDAARETFIRVLSDDISPLKYESFGGEIQARSGYPVLTKYLKTVDVVFKKITPS